MTDQQPRDLCAALIASLHRAKHTLVRDGEVDPLDRRPLRESGRAECSCRRWVSNPLLTAEARRAAHAQHVTNVTTTKGDA